MTVPRLTPYNVSDTLCEGERRYVLMDGGKLQEIDLGLLREASYADRYQSLGSGVYL